MEHQTAPFPGVSNIPFLQDDFIRHYSAMASIETGSIEEIIRLKNMLLLKEPFVRLLWDFHDLLYEQELPFRQVIPEDPKLGRLLGDALRGVFYYLLILSGLPLAIRRYQERGWSEVMFEHVFADLAVWVAHHQRNFGTPGFAWMVMDWFQGHINLHLIACGRLQFNTHVHFHTDIKVFRNRISRQVLPLVSAEKRFTAQGILDDLKDEPSENSWMSRYAEEPDTVTGNPVTPDGFVHPEPVTLKRTEWETVLESGDPIINIHIPESGPLRPEWCHESMLEARDFFAQYLPDFHWKAFFCDSWLLDPQLPEILTPQSNILSFQKHGYMIPFPGKADTVFRCFGIKGARDGIGTVPLRSSLQHSLANFLKSGREFHNGAAILLRDDLDTYQPYRD